MKLYHFSSSLPAHGGTLDPKRLGQNPWTKGDAREVTIPRVYFYIDPKQREAIFTKKSPIFEADVPDDKIYDIDADPKNFKRPGMTATYLIAKIASKYHGLKYGNVVALFRKIAVKPAKVKLAREDVEAHAREYHALHKDIFGLDRSMDHPAPTWNPDLSRRAAEAFERAKHTPNNRKVRQAYDQLAKEIEAQYQFLVNKGVKFEPWTGEGQPYANSKAMTEDVYQNGHLWYFPAAKGHGQNEYADPSMSKEITDKFRAVHDYFGHAIRGHQFGPKGELQAWGEHAKMFSPLARAALTVETHGQNSWVNFGPHSHLPVTERPYAAQKATLLPKNVVPLSRPLKLARSIVYISPSEREGSTMDQAAAAFGSPEHQALLTDAEQLGGQATPAMGTWIDGAEESAAISADRSLAAKVAAILGKKYKQKGVAIFHPGDGSDTLDLIYLKGHDPITADKALKDVGIQFATHVPVKGGVLVHVIGADEGAVRSLNAKYKRLTGTAEFPGADTREDAAKVFDKMLLSRGEPDWGDRLRQKMAEEYDQHDEITPATGFIDSDGRGIQMGVGVRYEDHRALVPSVEEMKAHGWPEDVVRHAEEHTRTPGMYEAMRRSRLVRFHLGEGYMRVEWKHDRLTARQRQAIKDAAIQYRPKHVELYGPDDEPQESGWDDLRLSRDDGPEGWITPEGVFHQNDMGIPFGSRHEATLMAHDLKHGEAVRLGWMHVGSPDDVQVLGHHPDLAYTAPQLRTLKKLAAKSNRTPAITSKSNGVYTTRELKLSREDIAALKGLVAQAPSDPQAHLMLAEALEAHGHPRLAGLLTHPGGSWVPYFWATSFRHGIREHKGSGLRFRGGIAHPLLEGIRIFPGMHRGTRSIGLTFHHAPGVMYRIMNYPLREYKSAEDEVVNLSRRELSGWVSPTGEFTKNEGEASHGDTAYILLTQKHGYPEDVRNVEQLLHREGYMHVSDGEDGTLYGHHPDRQYQAPQLTTLKRLARENGFTKAAVTNDVNGCLGTRELKLSMEKPEHLGEPSPEDKRFEESIRFTLPGSGTYDVALSKPLYQRRDLVFDRVDKDGPPPQNPNKVFAHVVHGALQLLRKHNRHDVEIEAGTTGLVRLYERFMKHLPAHLPGWTVSNYKDKDGGYAKWILSPPSLKLARQKAPAGGMIVNNQFFKGGKFLPRALESIRKMRGHITLARVPLPEGAFGQKTLTDAQIRDIENHHGLEEHERLPRTVNPDGTVSTSIEHLASFFDRLAKKAIGPEKHAAILADDGVSDDVKFYHLLTHAHDSANDYLSAVAKSGTEWYGSSVAQLDRGLKVIFGRERPGDPTSKPDPKKWTSAHAKLFKMLLALTSYNTAPIRNTKNAIAALLAGYRHGPHAPFENIPDANHESLAPYKDLPPPGTSIAGRLKWQEKYGSKNPGYMSAPVRLANGKVVGLVNTDATVRWIVPGFDKANTKPGLIPITDENGNLRPKTWGSMGVDRVRKFKEFISRAGSYQKAARILEREWTPAQLKALFNLKTVNRGDLEPGAKIPGSFAFGPKFGAFFQNLRGEKSRITMDKWYSRTMARLVGNLIGNGKLVEVPDGPRTRRLWKRVGEAVAKRLGIPPADMQAVLWYYEQNLWRLFGAKNRSEDFADGIREALKTHGFTK